MKNPGQGGFRSFSADSPAFIPIFRISEARSGSGGDFKAFSRGFRMHGLIFYSYNPILLENEKIKIPISISLTHNERARLWV